MINPKDLIFNDIGRKVVYKEFTEEPEYGTLTSWNEQYIFVRFKGPTGEACRPATVSFATKEQPV